MAEGEELASNTLQPGRPPGTVSETLKNGISAYADPAETGGVRSWSLHFTRRISV